MNGFDYQSLLVRLLPETFLVIGALIVLFVDQAYCKRWSLTKRASVATAMGIATILVTIGSLWVQTDFYSAYRGMLVFTPFTRIVKMCLLVLTFGTLLIANPSRFTVHIGEYVALLLFATVGMLLLSGTEELLTAFIGLELTSLSLYLLTGFNKQDSKSTEAAMKYFLFGSAAAAFTLFGISWVYGAAGSTSFIEIAASLRLQEFNPFLVTAIVLVSIGFAFKMAAAPLHLWAPDTYQGAPIPSAALIASGSKLASLVFFLKFFVLALPAQAGNAALGQGQLQPGWMWVIAIMASASMILGTLLAIVQSNFRRLLAYSAIAHAGYVLIAVLARNDAGAASAVYYLFTYGLSVIGAFAVISLIEQRHGELQIRELAGLYRRAPLLALSLFVFILSLAGIPPLAGFFGKFYVFLGALEGSMENGSPTLVWIVALALGTSAVSFYYYLQVLKQAFVVESEAPPLRISAGSSFALAFLAAAVLLLGCFPEVINSPLRHALSQQKHLPEIALPNQ